MKKQPLAKSQHYHSFLAFSLFLVFLLVSNLSYGQLTCWLQPTVAYNGYATSFTQNERINSDMYNYYQLKPGASTSTRQGSLFAVVWDDVFVSSSNLLLVDDVSPSSPTNVSLPSGAIHPDVVIGDDPANPGTDLIASIVYESSGAVYYVSCSITGVGTGSLSTTLGTPVQISCSGCTAKDPHIDMAGDIHGTTVYTQGFNALYDYVIEWSENPGPSWEIRAFKWDLAAAFPTPPLTTQFIDYGEMGDVAFTMDIAASPLTQKAYFIYYDPGSGGNIKYADWDPSSPTVNTHPTLENLVLDISPRIEATNVIRGNGINNTNSDIQWMAIAAKNNSGFHEIHTYSETIGNPISIINYADNSQVPATPVNMLDPVAWTSYCPTCGWVVEAYNPAICVGNGQATAGTQSDIGNYTYTTAFATDNGAPPLYVSTSQDLTNSNLAGFYMMAGGWGPVGNFTSSIPAVSVSNGSNDGYGLATASELDNGYIFYKFCGNTFVYKPTDVKGNIENNNVKVYPNPTTDKIFINGITSDANYTITDITGAVLLNGKLNKARNSFTTRELPAGMYILSLTENDKTQKIKLIKQ